MHFSSRSSRKLPSRLLSALSFTSLASSRWTASNPRSISQLMGKIHTHQNASLMVARMDLASSQLLRQLSGLARKAHGSNDTGALLLSMPCSLQPTCSSSSPTRRGLLFPSAIPILSMNQVSLSRLNRTLRALRVLWKMILTLRCLAPFRSVVKYEQREFDMGAIYGLGKNMSLNTQKENIDFNGPPRSELENAWDDLLRCKPASLSNGDLKFPMFLILWKSSKCPNPQKGHGPVSR